MKKLNFETSKGKFVVVDMPEQKGKAISLALLCNSNFGEKEFKDSTYLGYISELTEDKASEIVEEYFSTTTNEIDGFIEYHDGTQTDCPIESVHSLITSEGYYLFDNPYKHPDNISIQPASLGWWKQQEDKFIESEKRTFLNPIIFKLV